jgi:signal transduction histidine kinase
MASGIAGRINMDKWILIFALLCLLAALLLMIWNTRRTKRTMDTIEKMLETAMNGTFTEETFDESRLSALETKFAHYLSASAVSAQAISEEKDKIKSLISDISHQTKTPIANLLLYSELLQEEPLPDSARSSVEAIHSQAEKLRFLIDSLVKLSRLENGILTLAPKQEPLGPMLQAVSGQFVPKAAQKGLTLNFTDTDITAAFDPKWTAEALENLVDNAIKYTEQGSVTLSATAYEMFARIDVTDTGIGISEEEQAKIFSRFYRSESARNTEGVGIGLYLAREIVSGAGGYLKVTSSPGQGATFSLFLPR